MFTNMLMTSNVTNLLMTCNVYKFADDKSCLQICWWHVMFTNLLMTSNVYTYGNDKSCLQICWWQVMFTNMLMTSHVYKYADDKSCLQICWWHVMFTNLLMTSNVYKFADDKWCLHHLPLSIITQLNRIDEAGKPENKRECLSPSYICLCVCIYYCHPWIVCDITCPPSLSSTREYLSR